MKNESDFGYVYILTNPSFKDDWVKIGMSTRPVDVRSKELDNTAVPLPFEIYATLKTRKYQDVEKHLHKMIDRLTDLRIRQNREFFNIAPDMALELLKDCAKLLDDAELMVYQDGKPMPADSSAPAKKEHDGHANGPKRARFKFSMIGLPIGTKLIFTPTNLEVTVADDSRIEYEGRLYKLSPFVGTFMPEERRTASGAYQGAKFFTYNGEVLDDIRTRMEHEQEN